jgi:hypothetical protein
MLEKREEEVEEEGCCYRRHLMKRMRETRELLLRVLEETIVAAEQTLEGLLGLLV